MVEAEKNDRDRAQGTRGFHISGFPIEFWDDWDADCKENYGDCRWIKIWNDHMKTKEANKYQFLLNKINKLEERLDEVDVKKEDTKPVVTLGGNVIGGK